MATKSFIEVLEEQIRSDLRSEIEAEVLLKFGHSQLGDHPGPPSPAVSAAQRLETWLISKVDPTVFQSNRTPKTHGRSAYAQTSKAFSAHAKATTATTSPFQRPEQETPNQHAKENSVRVTSTEELYAVELLRRYGNTGFGEVFTEAELKATWRKAALKTHPDRFSNADLATQAQMSALFMELSSAYDVLDRVLDLKIAA